jgi:hypothetical protein
VEFQRHLELARRRDLLSHARVGLHKPRAQHFMTIHDRFNASEQRRRIQLALQAQRQRHIVIGAALLQLRQKPEPLLPVGQRCDIRTRAFDQCNCIPRSRTLLEKIDDGCFMQSQPFKIVGSQYS